MYCRELDQLLDEHSALTMLLFRQDGRTQGWYRTREEWERECEKLRSVERELSLVTAELAQHRRRHGCGAAVLTTGATGDIEVGTGRARL